MIQLVTFKTQDGEREYYTYGIYNDIYSDQEVIHNFYGSDNLVEDEKGSEEYCLDTSLVRIYNRVSIDDDKIKILRENKILL